MLILYSPVVINSKTLSKKTENNIKKYRSNNSYMYKEQSLFKVTWSSNAREQFVSIIGRVTAISRGDEQWIKLRHKNSNNEKMVVKKVPFQQEQHKS